MTTESNTEEQSGAVERKINPKRSRSKKTKAEKLSSGYGWTASLPNSRIKVEINGEEVELPVTINFNVSVQGSKK
nr:2744_t:CDS:2 [Entrophospora candida]